MLRFCLALFLLSPAIAQAAPPLPQPPAGFEISLFGVPPQVNYPVCLSAAPSGELFVGIDRQGSLGKKPGEGKVLRCIDTDSDGQADQINTFVEVDHPRGLVYDRGRLWVLHPPNLSVYIDDDLDGKSDREEVLVTGITTEQLHKRGADHTTNGIRMGIDGWIYIAVGDFGFVDAKGKDGTTLTLRGGGIVRVRPNGSELEVFCKGTRNILDVCIDPQLNMFTRDNTNDGGGWDIRLSHIVQNAHYGYPSLYMHFSDEIMRPLADYGGGSGCGSMFVAEPWLPEKYHRALLTCDWGRNQVYYHPLQQAGASYTAEQETFLSIQRPTDIDVDGSGRLYVASWRNGKFDYSGEDVGYVVMLKPAGAKPPKFPDLSKQDDAALLAGLDSESYVRRFHTQHEILRRGKQPSFESGLLKRIEAGSLDTRVAALFTFAQLYGTAGHAKLLPLVKDDALREFVLRALTDRKPQLKDVPADLFVQSLRDPNPRVRLAAIIGLTRLGQRETANALLPLAMPLDGDASKPAAKAPLASYKSSVVKGKKKPVEVTLNLAGAKKLFLVVGDGGNGNGNDHADWIAPRLVGKSGEKKLTDLKWTEAKAGWGGVHVNKNCRNLPLQVAGKTIENGVGTHAPSVICYEIPDGYDRFEATGMLDDGSNGKGSVVFEAYAGSLPSAMSVEKTHNQPKPEVTLPHVATRALAALDDGTACLAALDGPYRAAALRAMRYMHTPKVVDGLIARLGQSSDVEAQLQVLTVLIRLYHREGDYKGDWWGTRPDTTGPYYQRVTWEKSAEIEAAIRKMLTELPTATGQIVTELNRHHVRLKDLPVNETQDYNQPAPAIAVKIPEFDQNNPNQLGNIPYEQIQARVAKLKGNAKQGEEIFKRQSCVACHTTNAGQRPIGPSLVQISKRYNRQQLTESILKPSAQIAQGFHTNVIVTADGKTYNGFVTREAADEVELRTGQGTSFIIAKAYIDEREQNKVSAMPDGIARNLTVDELASLLAYLESLK